jgi:D-alanyl-D-alanine carboxypeptidase-like protein/putative Flp pilus-assembly TadE/G-like protein
VDDRGSVSILAAGLLILLTAAGVGAIRVAEAEALREGAQTAADAVALAAARDGSLASAIASANAATLLRVTTGEGWLEVEVMRRGAKARARATLPRSVARAASSSTGLSPLIVAALRRAELILGRPIRIVSGYRSHAEQLALWARRYSNPYPVAAPGTSAHERGLAVDLSEADAALVESLHVGLCRPYGNDPVHLELCPR